MSLLANSNAIESGGYNIDRSLRFRSSASAYLNRTPASSGSGSVWTYSAWVKRGQISQSRLQYLMTAIYDGALTSGILFQTDDTFRVFHYNGYTVGTVYNFVTSQVFRDPSAWYHFVVSSNGGSWMRIYVNGVQITSFSTSTGPSATASLFNQTYGHQIGAWTYSGTNAYFDGLISEMNWIDGQALAATDFGQTDPETGVWKPKKYTGTYGTNGFYLPFSDNTSATTLAYDKSGNGNNWTANNISTTSGATYDSMTDVPTLTSATAANYCVLNPLDNARAGGGVTYTNGNLTLTGNGQGGARSTFGLTSGKWRAELTCTSGSRWQFGISNSVFDLYNSNTGKTVFYDSTGYIEDTGTAKQSSLASCTTGDVITIDVDVDAGTIAFYKNGSTQIGTTYSYTAFTPVYVMGYMVASSVGNLNCGQRPFTRTTDTSFKALNTFNLPDPTIKKPNQYMDATLYTGNGTSQSVVNAAGFQPDFVWIKLRNQAGDYHNLFDSVRGVYKRIFSNDTNAEDTNTQTLTAFNSNGFSVGNNGNVNTNAINVVGWQWKKGATPGFDIVTYTGTGSATTVAHSLGVAPKMYIIKNRTTAGYSWHVYHAGISATPQNAVIWLDSTAAANTAAATWNNTAPTSSVFSVNGGSSYVGVNQTGNNYVAYLFAEIAGFSKFGSYTGNGSADGPFVATGHQGRYLLIKRTDTSGYPWVIRDTARNPYNTSNLQLEANSSGAEATPTTKDIDFVSNGFKIRGTGGDINDSGATYVYASFASNPFKYSNAR